MEGEVPADDFALVDIGNEVRYCKDIYSEGPFNIPQDNCTFLQNLGTSMCKCGEQQSSPTNDCRLCEDETEELKMPLLESLPGEFCAETEIQARRDDESTCVHYQGVVGVYCQCKNNKPSLDNVCRLCRDGVLLPDPTKAVGEKSCMFYEFNASIHGTCPESQALYASSCCQRIDNQTNSGAYFTPALQIII
eukprot:CAMPEP_0194247918 /NCGR_PEP_ID=MMETSP0158-20130606/17201_1 /TAXON_ID=33649 /ORGANISM="Thalassionema nitzschioides, Strain L26-B" /LENGTH=191 /DNA_ID=CAMNT_0038984071 /DNA_START=100 /DNA_END=672 /DNA_ORIENTATION=+